MEMSSSTTSALSPRRLVRRISGGRARAGDAQGPWHPPCSVLSYGIGLGPGVGATLQMVDAQGGRGGVGIRKSLPCLAGEQLGSVAGLHVMQLPVKVLMSGYGVVNPSVSVCIKVTIRSSS